MTTQAKIGHGSLFQILTTEDIGSPPAPVTDWLTVAEVVSITPPSLSRDAVDATHTESPEKWREFIPGLRDGGEVSCEMNFIPAGPGTEAILASFNSDTVQSCRIIFPDGDANASPITATVWAFSGFITAFAPEAPFDGKMAATVTVKLSGKPAFLTA
jgi:predicted secreted protein